MIGRRMVVLQGVAALALGAAGGVLQAIPARAEGQGLVFDPEAYETLSTTVETSRGTVAVRYRFWRAIPYVARPVAPQYQVLNVSVPVEIDGVAVDASAGPILLANAVGGYMPSDVSAAKGVDESMAGPPPGMMPPGMMPPGMAAPSGSALMLARGKRVSNAKLALAAGLVVVEPGARGRTLTDAAGHYIGTAPAVIVDLKAAVRFIRANAGRIPGNVERIVSSGTSAGGAVSALLGASGDSPLYAPMLAELGAAEASDAIFATGAWCPITDLEHADAAYEWCWGPNPVTGAGAVDPALSADLAAAFAPYQDGLGLDAPDGSGPLTAAAFPDYLLRAHLVPQATAHLAALSETDRQAYLAAHPHIGWQDGRALFDWPGFIAHVGTRKKSLPAFDGFVLETGENNLFGLGLEKARHFTAFAAAQTGTTLAADIPEKLRLMNPMGFLLEAHPGRSRHWWLRTGTSDTDTSLSILANLAAAAAQTGDAVDLRYYWNAGHGANEDAEGFIDWIKAISA